MSSNRLENNTTVSLLTYARNQDLIRHVRAVPAPTLHQPNEKTLIYVRAHYRRRKGCK